MPMHDGLPLMAFVSHGEEYKIGSYYPVEMPKYETEKHAPPPYTPRASEPRESEFVAYNL